MDSMRSSTDAGEPNRGAYTDYRGSSLFAFSGPFIAPPAPATTLQKTPANSTAQVQSHYSRTLEFYFCQAWTDVLLLIVLKHQPLSSWLSMRWLTGAFFGFLQGDLRSESEGGSLHGGQQG